MLTLNKVAVTGGLSCGKSSVCRILKELGAYVISADEIVHQLLSPDTNLGQEVIKLFGTEILVNNQIDRPRVAQLAFRNNHLLSSLENLLHPVVYERINNEYQSQREAQHPPSLFVAEIPLLFESGGEKYYDYTVAVVSNPDLCFQRFTKATGYNKHEFDKRMKRQLALLDKAVRSDYTIMNNSTLSYLQDVTKELYYELIES